MKKLLRQANQMFVGGRLYYVLKQREFSKLTKYRAANPAVELALRASAPLSSHPAPLFLVPVDLMKEAEGDMVR